MEFFRESPGAIARRFTLGQLAVMAWALHERARRSAEADDAAGEDLDLRALTGAALERHLLRLGT